MRWLAPKPGPCTRGMLPSPGSGSAGMHSQPRTSAGSAPASGWQMAAALRSPQVRSAKGPVHVVIEYDGFEHHFQKNKQIHVGNHQRYLVEADVERQLTLESYGYRFPEIAKNVSKPMLRIYPQLKDTRIDFAWGGTLAITMNRMPCFMRPQPNVLSASGYSGHGVAMATMAGKLLAEATVAQSSGFDLMANLPQPGFPGGVGFRWPLLVLAMTWYSMRDRLGI